MSAAQAPIVVVTGANGLVGSQTCHALLERGADVRALVRRPGTAPAEPGVIEVVGDPAEPKLLATVLAGADAVVTTVHPLGASAEEQRQVAVEGTPVVARVARDAGVARLVHVSTAAVYERAPGAGDVAEDADLVGDDAGGYAVTKRDADQALAGVDGITRVLVRPPAILGPGATSIWNTVRPAAMRTRERARRSNPDGSFPWIHVVDLAALLADVAVGAIPPATNADDGPVASGCTPVNAAASTARQRDYYETVCEALSVAPEWTDEPVWTGQYLTERAHRWGWRPRVELAEALDELRSTVRLR